MALPAQEQASRLHLQTREVAAWFHQGPLALGTNCGGVQLEGKSGHETCMSWQPSCPKGPGHRWSAWGACGWRQCMTDPRSVGCGPVLQVHHLLPRHHMCWSCAGSPVGEKPGRVALCRLMTLGTIVACLLRMSGVALSMVVSNTVVKPGACC